ncbi:MAG: tRNA (adenosine(37)-N6)-threonylcarbamoyltransferase complex dimerization subunit type 1 TsaB [Candidatus Firestonebacteria bacterium]
MENIILGIETSTFQSGVALAEDGKVLIEHTVNLGPTYSSKLLLDVQYILSEAKISAKDLSGIGVSLGPGSFTGLRVGLSFAKGMTFSGNIPIIGVPTLDVLAFDFINHNALICPIIDAKKEEVYSAFYISNNERQIKKTDYLLLKYSELIKKAKKESNKKSFDKIIFTGEITDTLKKLLLKHFSKKLFLHYTFPSPKNIAIMAAKKLSINPKGDNADTLVPIYLRKPYAIPFNK